MLFGAGLIVLAVGLLCFVTLLRAANRSHWGREVGQAFLWLLLTPFIAVLVWGAIVGIIDAAQYMRILLEEGFDFQMTHILYGIAAKNRQSEQYGLIFHIGLIVGAICALRKLVKYLVSVITIRVKFDR